MLTRPGYMLIILSLC